MFEVSLTSCFFTQDTELQLLKKGKYPGNQVKHSSKLAAKGNCNLKVFSQKLNKIMSSHKS